MLPWWHVCFLTYCLAAPKFSVLQTMDTIYWTDQQQMTAQNATSPLLSPLTSSPATTKINHSTRHEILTAESFLWSSTSQKIPHILHNPKVHYCVHKSPPFAPFLNHMNPAHTPLKSHFSTQYVLISSWSSMQFYPSGFQAKPVHTSRQHPTWHVNCPLHCPWTNPLAFKADQIWCAAWC